MKKIFSVLMLIMVFTIASVMNVEAKNAKKFKGINKNDTSIETAAVEAYCNGFNAYLSLIIVVDAETSAVDSNLHIKLVSNKKNEKSCDAVRITKNEPILVGQSGGSEDDINEYEYVDGYRRWYTESHRCACEAIYDIEVEALFEADKIRIMSDKSFIDLNFKSVRRELKHQYEKSLKRANETYNQKTNPYHNF